MIYGNPTARELALKPPTCQRLVQVAPDGRKTLYLAAHAKMILGRSYEDSQKLIWELIDHCTQPKVRSLASSGWDVTTDDLYQYVFSMEWQSGGDFVWWDNRYVELISSL